MQVEDVAGIRLAARRAAQEQRQLAVGVRVLGEVVVDDQRVLAVVEEVLGDGRAGERRHPLDRRRLGRRRGDDDRVVHRAFFLEALVHLRDRRALLADRDVDADHVGVALVDDCVDRDGGLAGAAVADDQLALAPADVRHRVDRLDAGLERLLHRLALDHTRRPELERATLGRLDRAGSVERIAERIDDATEQGVTDGDVDDGPCPLDRLTLLDVLPLAEQGNADVVLLEVERDADDAVLELEPLERDGVLEAVDAGDPVADLEHRAHLGEVGLDVVLLDPRLEDRRDLFRA